MKNGQLFKLILILFIFVVSANIAKSETYGWYASFDSTDRNISFNLNIFVGNMYQIKMDNNLPDGKITSLILSRGYYKLVDDSLYLTDYYNKYKMLIIINNEKLYVKKAFKILYNRSFRKLHSEPYHTTKMVFNERLLDSVRSDYNKDYKTEFPFADRIYGVRTQVYFNLKPDNKYQLKYNQMVVSDGSWERKGNELICKDSLLQHNFYLSIGQNKIIHRFFPYIQKECVCEYGGCVLE